MYSFFQATSQTTALRPFGGGAATSDSSPTNESPKPINEPYEPPESPRPFRRDSYDSAPPSNLTRRIAELELDLEEAQFRLKDEVRVWKDLYIGLVASNDAEKASKKSAAANGSADTDEEFSRLKSQTKKAGSRAMRSAKGSNEQQVVENAWLQAELGILEAKNSKAAKKNEKIRSVGDAETAYLRSQIKKATRALRSAKGPNDQQVVENAWLQAGLGILIANDGMAATKNAFANSQMDFDGSRREANMRPSATNAYNRQAESLEMDFQARLNDARQAHKTEIQTLEKTIVSYRDKLKTTQDQLERANSRIDELEDGAGMPTSEELDEANKRIKYLTEKMRRQAESLRNATAIEKENQKLKTQLEDLSMQCRKQQAQIEDLENKVSEMYSSRPRQRVPPSSGPPSRNNTENRGNGISDFGDRDDDIIDFTDRTNGNRDYSGRANGIRDYSGRAKGINDNGGRVNGISDFSNRGNGFGDTIRRQPTMSRRRRPSENDYVSPPQSQYDMNASSDYRNPDPNMQSSAISASVPTNSSIMPIYEESRPGADRFKRSIQGNYNPRTRRMQRDFSNTRPEE